jgi:hypothetical protein
MKIHLKYIFLILFFSSSLALKAESNQSRMPSLKKIGEDKFRFGEVMIDQKNRILEFNATSNQRNGLIEYALVHESGKTHEALFRTKVRPQIFHACFLLFRHPREDRFFENLWSEKPNKLDFSKSRIRTEVKWDENGSTYKRSLEELAFNSKNQQSLKQNAFIFTGSKKIEGTYLAELSGSMIAVYADEEAVINSSDHDSNNDDVWLANEKQMPELETPVRIRFLLPKAD